MREISLLLDVTSLTLASCYIAFRLVRYERVRVDHVLLFTIGFAYYISLSSVLAHVDLLPEYYANPFRTFDAVPPARRALASLWGLLLLLAFFLGTVVADRLPSRPGRAPSRARVRASILPATIIAGVTLMAFLAACVLFRRVLTEGYRSADPDLIQSQQGRGTLAAMATASALASLAALHAATSRFVRTASRIVAAAVGALAIAVPVLILPIGGNRLYSVSLVVVVVTWISHAHRPFRRSTVLGGATLGLVSLIALGSLRIGQIPALSTTTFYASSESALGGWTRDLFLRSASDPLVPIAVPKYLGSDLVNLVPRFLLPAKDELRLDPADAGYSLVSPLGGTHLSASMWLNFGYVGSLIVMALLAFGLRRLQRRVVTHEASSWTVAYAVMSGGLALSFFRDEFGISIVRWGVLNAVVIVGMIHVATRIVAVGLSHVPPPAASPPLRRRPAHSLGDAAT